jgi:two-component system chemotaxis response regulator CheB
MTDSNAHGSSLVDGVGSKPRVRVMVVDDSTIFRRMLCQVLEEDPRIEVVTTAINGATAMLKLAHFRPDVITLDLEMPVLDGFGVLDRLREMPDAPRVVVVSAVDARSQQATLTALERGAVDFLVKPSTSGLDASLAELRRSVPDRIVAIARGGVVNAPTPPAEPTRAQRATASDEFLGRAIGRDVASPQTIASGGVSARGSGRPRPRAGVRAVVIGVSTGGPQALAQLVPQLPADLPVPVLLVQHMPPKFTTSLAESLDRKSVVTVREATGGEALEPGHVYLAPGGRHLVVRSGPDARPRTALDDGPPENSCRPAADVLFRTAVDVFGGDVLAVVLTGMGEDGARGCEVVRARGGFVIAQDEATSVLYGMPRRVAEIGAADEILPLDGIARAIVEITRVGGRIGI